MKSNQIPDTLAALGFVFFGGMLAWTAPTLTGSIVYGSLTVVALVGTEMAIRRAKRIDREELLTNLAAYGQRIQPGETFETFIVRLTKETAVPMSSGPRSTCDIDRLLAVREILAVYQRSVSS